VGIRTEDGRVAVSESVEIFLASAVKYPVIV